MGANFHPTDISCQSNTYPQHPDQQLWPRNFQEQQRSMETVESGKSISSMDAKSKEESSENSWGCSTGQSAFLGPNIWDKNIPHNPDLRIGAQYIDLDDFLSENGIPLEQQGYSNENGQAWKRNEMDSDSQHYTENVTKLGVVAEVLALNSKGEYESKYQDGDSSPNFGSSTSTGSTKDEPLSPECSSAYMYYGMSGRDFDPRMRAFSDEELKPQVMVKKSRKKFVPDDMKDDKYWARRRKNNIAAKRSRDARRVKENQIALRAGFLEKENSFLRKEMEKLKKENNFMRLKLEKTPKNSEKIS